MLLVVDDQDGRHRDLVGGASGRGRTGLATMPETPGRRNVRAGRIERPAIGQDWTG